MFNYLVDNFVLFWSYFESTKHNVVMGRKFLLAFQSDLRDPKYWHNSSDIENWFYKKRISKFFPIFSVFWTPSTHKKIFVHFWATYPFDPPKRLILQSVLEMVKDINICLNVILCIRMGKIWYFKNICKFSNNISCDVILGVYNKFVLCI